MAKPNTLTYSQMLERAKALSAESETKKELQDKLEAEGIHFDTINWNDDEEEREGFADDSEFAEMTGSFKTKSGAIATFVL